MPPKPRIRTPSPRRSPPPKQESDSDISAPKGIGGQIIEKVVEPAKEAVKDKDYTTDDLLDRSSV